MTTPPEDPILKSSRREALVIACLWLVAMFHCVLFSYFYGYPQPGVENPKIDLVWGIPFWAFWGVIVPWVSCAVLSIVFGCLFMRDEPLGEEAGDDESDLLS